MPKSFTRRQFNGGLMTGAALVASPALLTRRADAADYNLKYANNQPLTHPMNVRAKEAVDKIKNESNGRINIQIFPNNQLGGDTDMLSQVRSGAIDFFTLSGLQLQAIVPVAGANGIGFAFPDYDAVWAAMDGDFGAHLRQAMRQANLHVFERAWDNGFRQTTAAARVIKTPDDFRGFKIRIPVYPLLTSMFETLGAAPTGINIKEAYSALQTRLVDGQENPLAIIENWNFSEVQKYCAITNHVWDGFWMCGNRRSWERLPKDMQAIISRNWNEAALKDRADIRTLNSELRKTLEAKGMVFNEVDTEPFRAKLRDGGYYKKWREEFGSDVWTMLEKHTGKLG